MDTLEVSPSVNPAPVVLPPVPKKGTNWYLVGAGVVVIALSVAIYSIFNRYEHTKTELTETKKEVIVANTAVSQLQQEYSAYRQITEANTSWIKRPFVLKNEVVRDVKGNPVYTTEYTKHSSNSVVNNSGSTTATNTNTSSTTTITDTIKSKTDTEKGTRINGDVYIGLPFNVVTGKVDSLELGFDHNVILGFWLGADVGAHNLANLDFSKDLFFNFHIGHGIP